MCVPKCEVEIGFLGGFSPSDGHQLGKIAVMVLPSQDADNLHRVAVDTIIDRMRATHATAITGADMIHRREQQWPFRYQQEPLYQFIAIAIGLRSAELFITVIGDFD